MSTGKLIRKKREKLSLSQTDIAKKLGVTPQFISNIERGVCELPTKMYRETADLLKIYKSEFMSVRMGMVIAEVEMAMR